MADPSNPTGLNLWEGQMPRFPHLSMFAAAILAAALVASSPSIAAKGGGGRGGGGGVHVSGGGAHFGGGARMGGGARFSGARIAAPRIAGPRFSGGGRRFVGRPAVSRQFARPSRFNRAVANRGNANRFVNTNAPRNAAQSLNTANRNAVTQNARSNSVLNALNSRSVAGALSNRNAIQNPNSRARIAASAALAGWAGGRGYGWWRHHHGGYGWVGPLFWPFAYYDVYDYALWGYGYDPSFWDYGYNDIYAGLFSPYGYDDLIGYLPYGGAGRPPRSQPASASAPASPGDAGAQLAQMCGDDSRDVAGLPLDRIAQAIQPTDEQRAALDDLANASASAAQKIRAACPTDVTLTAPNRLAAMQTRVEAMLAAVKTTQPPLDKFYTLLSDEQKARLNALGVQDDRTGSVGNAATARPDCSTQTGMQWPASEITERVRPTEAQSVKLATLQDATSKASSSLAASCQPENSLTPPARLAAAEQRLETLLQAVTQVRSALDDFYGSLTDEQKAQFEAIGQQRDVTTVGQSGDSRPRYRRHGFGSVEGMIRHFIAIAR